MRNTTIIGAGQSGLQLGLGLRQKGYSVRLVSNRTAEDFAAGKVMSSQFMFNDALQSERDLGINYWEKQCPYTDAVGVTIGAPDGGKAVDWVYPLDRPGQAVDQRVKISRLDEKVSGAWRRFGHSRRQNHRSGKIRARERPRHRRRRQGRYHQAVRTRCRTLAIRQADACAGLDLRHRAHPLSADPGRLQYRADGRRIFCLSRATITGPCEIMVFEGIPGGPMDCWNDVKTPEQHLERSLDVLKKFYPWEAERSRNAKLTDPNGILSGRFVPTVRKPIARLPSGALVLGIADAVVLNDPITGQGSNNAAKSARIYLKRILEQGNKPFDAAWMQQTFDEYWNYAQFVTGWTNAMLQPPPPHVINILVAAQSKPKVGKAFVNGFDDPRTFFPWLADPAEAEKFVQAA